MDEDKYPPETDRRRFVKGVVGGSSMAAITTAGAAAVNTSTTDVGKGGGSVTYRAIRNTAGPAPRGLPQIPLETDDEGYIKGVWPEAETRTLEDGTEITVAETDIAGVTYSSRWFQYCGVQTYRNIRPDADHDNYIRYDPATTYGWQRESVEGGAKVHPEDFEPYEDWTNDIGDPGYGKPATCNWRSQADSVPSEETLPVQVIRSPRIEAAAEEDEWLAASTVKGCIAYLNKCTHFCCIPGFKDSGDAPKFGAANKSYCGCHQSVYDPFEVVEKTYIALPRPDE
ncbi:ubiquinol-cytochrome c reductase iron-sulfur subunit [Haloarchaeobius amylolyticus]|uniref:ubiquinol-cytochrome c reductase iron-sulfur subunit n=1 Tax=Haloarchaeobius amylolyticus TaxID=1198296 RepID=UPI002270B7E0|nr:ubiquinol-cytochrome c reductase iron-sulfur subunit [Haloarchaeobius amylolyticus]